MTKTHYKLMERDTESDNYNDWKWVEDAPTFDRPEDFGDWLEAKGIHPRAIENHYRAIMCWN